MSESPKLTPVEKNPTSLEANVEGPEVGEKLSKKQLKKLEAEKQKAEKKAQQKAEQANLKDQEVDPLAANYGDVELVQSQNQTNRKWTKVQEIEDALIGQEVLVRARVHNSRVKGNLAFLVLRDAFSTVQGIALKGETVSKQMLKFIGGITSESVVDVLARVQKPEQEIISCTQKAELLILKIHVISRSAPQLPFQIEDASRRIEKNEYEDEEHEKQQDEEKKDGDQTVKVLMKTRLDNRVIDLRTPAKVAIFRIQSAVSNLFREFLLKNDFIEIHTPKLIGGASEGGSNVFKLNYFNKPSCLAQSPQLYKQMVLMSDFDRVFEIAPVFRAENSNTHRHMCEFTSLDLEMTIKENYHELLDFLGELCVFIFNGIEERYAKEVRVIREQFPGEPFKIKTPVVKLTFQEGVRLLNEAGINQSPTEDLDTTNEKALGAIVKKLYDTDFYMLHRYPKNARPFYTMPCHDDPNYTLSYDFFMRGEEITSGAQRVHDPVLLENNIKAMGIPVETLRDYINSFKYGAYPHGGCALGLERVVFLYFGLGNIRNAALFPRDPIRLTP